MNLGVRVFVDSEHDFDAKPLGQLLHKVVGLFQILVDVVLDDVHDLVVEIGC